MLPLFHYFKRKELLCVLQKAFPRECEEDVAAVVNRLSLTKKGRDTLSYYTNKRLTAGEISYTLLTGERVTLPYRLYIDERRGDAEQGLSERQRFIYHALFSRSYDGYTREKHAKALITHHSPAWVIPYILELSGEYVKEILEAVYRRLSTVNTIPYRRVCALNFERTTRLHARMICYWNERYRYECYRYRDYIGKRLFAECFGYRKTGQKKIELYERKQQK